jgi:V/A-type H+-transporting ATPase subunit I
VAVDSMKMMNLVAPLEYIDAIARDIVLLGNVHIVNALHEVDESNFSLPVTEENIDKLKGLVFTRPYPEDGEFKSAAVKIDTLMHIFGIQPELKDEYLTLDYRIEDDIEWIEQVYKVVLPLHENITSMEGQLKSLEETENCFEYLRESDVDLSLLTGLQFFKYKIGILSRENRLRLRQNYENIVAVVLKTGTSRRGDVYLVILPTELEIETERIFRTLNFHKLEIPEELLGTYQQIRKRVEDKKKQIRLHLKEHRRDLYRLKKMCIERLNAIYSRMLMEEEISGIKKETACSGSYFYLSGWVPARNAEYIGNTLRRSRDNVYIMFKEAAEVNEYLIPPTRLKTTD